MVLKITPYPASITADGGVTFFASWDGGTRPTTYSWNFGDGGTSTEPLAVHVYPTAASPTFYTVTLTTDTGATTTVMYSDTTSDTLDTTKYPRVSVFIYDDTNGMMVSRLASACNSLYLMNPVITNNLDTTQTSTFTLLDVGNSTAVERSLIAEDKWVLIIQHESIVFSGVIRRATQGNQSSYYAATSRIKQWNIECDSDLTWLKSQNVSSTALSTYGSSFVDTPGMLVRRVASTTPDIRGVIDCLGQDITYQINPSTTAESAGSIHSHVTTIRDATNYDLVTRFDYYVFDYTSGTTGGVTLSSSVSENLVGQYFFIIPSSSYQGVVTWRKITGHTGAVITGSSTDPMVTPEATGRVIVTRGVFVDFARDLTTASPVLWASVNKDLFDYSDNDDRGKFISKVVAKGKDINGKSISVSLTGCHAVNDNTKEFNDSTYITRASEGYVYKTNFVTGTTKAATVYVADTQTFTTNYASGYHNTIYCTNAAKYPTNAPVTFVGGTLPSGISASTTYYIRDKAIYGENTFNIALTPGGTAVDIGSDKSGTCYVISLGGLVINNADAFIKSGDSIVLYGTTAPGSCSFGLNTNASPTYTSASYFIYLGYSIGPGAGSGVYVTKPANIGNSALGYTPRVWVYGHSLAIPSGSSMIFSIPHSGVTATTTTSAITEGTDGSGIKYSAMGLTAFPTSDFSGRGYLLNTRLYVKNAAAVGSNAVLIGEEPVTISGTGNDATYGNYITLPATRYTTSAKKCYPHGIGCLVARTNYTEASPETGSPLEAYGLKIETITVDNSITYADLDTYSTQALYGNSPLFKKIVCWMPITLAKVTRPGIPCSTSAASKCHTSPPRVGDKISIAEYDGATPSEFQIVTVKIDYDGGKVTMNIGDYERNVFSDMERKTNGINKTFT